MVTVGLPNNRSSIWQVFVIDPESGEISLIPYHDHSPKFYCT